MDAIPSLFGQLSELAAHHAPAQALSAIVPIAGAALCAGIIISVLGARLVRPMLTACFFGLGALAGSQIAPAWDLSMPLSVLIGAVLAGALGHVLFRLWVGVGVGAVLAATALAGVGVWQLQPELVAFQQARPLSMYAPGATSGGIGLESLGADGQAVPSLATLDFDGDSFSNRSTDFASTSAFTLPAPGESQAQDTLREAAAGVSAWGQDFWAYVKSQKPNVQKWLPVTLLLTGLIGLLIGAGATRASLIALSAVLGTGVVMGSMLLLSSRLAPQMHNAALSSPNTLLAAAGGLWVVSVILQAILNQRPPAKQTSLKPVA